MCLLCHKHIQTSLSLSQLEGNERQTNKWTNKTKLTLVSGSSFCMQMFTKLSLTFVCRPFCLFVCFLQVSWLERTKFFALVACCCLNLELLFVTTFSFSFRRQHQQYSLSLSLSLFFLVCTLKITMTRRHKEKCSSWLTCQDYFGETFAVSAEFLRWLFSLFHFISSD